MNSLLPDALRKALAQVIADLEREWRKDIERMQAEARATQAESRATVAKLENEVLHLKEQLRETTTLQVTAALAAIPAPRDGQNADPEMVKALVAEAIAKLPVPKDGIDADPEDITARLKTALEPFLAETRAASIEAAREGAGTPNNGDAGARAREEIAALTERIRILEVTSVADAHVRAAVDVAVAGAMATLPVPKDGEPGKDADPALVEHLVEDRVAKAIAALPPPPKPQVSSELVEDVKAYITEQAQHAVAASATDGALAQKLAEAVTHRVLALMSVPDVVKPLVDERVAELKALIVESVAAIPPPKDGKDGKDVDPQEVRTMVEQAVAALPPAEPGVPGKPGKDADMAAVEQMIAEKVLHAIAGETETLKGILVRSVADAVAALPPAEPGAPGKDVDMAVVQASIDAAVGRMVARLNGELTEKLTQQTEAAVEKAVAALPAPEPGAPGKDADMAAVQQMVERAAQQLPLVDLVAAEIAKLPPPEPGKPGQDADMAAVQQIIEREAERLARELQVKPEAINEAVAAEVAKLPKPKDGEPGKSVSVEEITPVIAEHVQKAVDAIPPPKDGKDGKDGISLADAAIDRDGALVMILSNGNTKNLGRVVGRDIDAATVQNLLREEVAKIPPAKDGEDGFGFDDLFVRQADERTMLVEFRKGTKSKSFPVVFPVQINRGVFREGQMYQRGDVVTLGGSQWHCETETAEKPGENAQHWKLSVKRGRDGKTLELADVQPLVDKAVARARAGVPLQP